MGNIFGDFEAKTTVLHSFRFVVYFSSMNHITKDHLQLKKILRIHLIFMKIISIIQVIAQLLLKFIPTYISNYFNKTICIIKCTIIYV
jgi:hypothetical protein